MKNNTIHIIISGGGTGGHIFPAIAIANALKERLRDKVDILFVGALGRMEMEKVPLAGYSIKGLWISGFQRKHIMKNLLFPVKLLCSLAKATRILRKFDTKIVVGTGGYASGPLLYKAARKGIPTLILEQNSYPGITNKILAKKADRICTAYAGMEKYFAKEKIKITGSPIRKEILQMKISKEKALRFFELSERKKTILVIGGSQGAKKINEAVAASLNKIVTNETQLIWQTGKLSFDEIRKIVSSSKFKKTIKVFDFIYEMGKAYAAADIVVSRAGAIAIAEITAVGKPAVFIPLPSAAEDHQTHNAKTLVDKGAALMLKETDAEKHLAEMLNKLLGDEHMQNNIRKKLQTFRTSNAANLIVNEILDLIKK